jgi:hypothetical protein
VAFCGPKYCGKDTAARTLLDLNQERKPGEYYIFRRAPVAEGIKNVLREMFGWDDSIIEDPIAKEKDIELYPGGPVMAPRWPMMDGANWMRDKWGPAVHAKRWERVSLQRDHPPMCHVITDMRFPEEVDMTEDHDTLRIYIERAEAEAKIAEAKKAGDAMALNRSESHFDMLRRRAHIILPNNGEIYQLRNEVHAAVNNRFGYWGHWGR